MPSAAAGTTIDLDAFFTDNSGQATTPTTPVVSIVNPSGTEVVTDDTPDATAQEGRYTYAYDIPGVGPYGTWTAVWGGTIAGESIESTQFFTVTSAGGIHFESDCLLPVWEPVDTFIGLHPEVDSDDALSALQEATWILNGLTTNRYHGVECRRDVYMLAPSTRTMELSRQPVDTVFSVATLDQCSGTETEMEGWCQLAGGRVQLGPRPSSSFGSLTCGCSERIVVVEYRTKSNLPPGTARVTDRLAMEIWKASTGRACSLPERVTNVSREGVSWTILDPLDFLDKGLTGIGSIDQWIARANGRGLVKLIDPLKQPPVIESDVVGCGEGCVPL